MATRPSLTRSAAFAPLQTFSHCWRCVAFLCIAAAALLVGSPAAADPVDLDALQGKWSTVRTNREGRVYSQALEFNKDQLTLRITGEDGEVRLFARAKAKITRAGPVQVLDLSDLQAGRSPDDLQPLDDNPSVVITFYDGKLYLASNFDKERSNQYPRLEVYVRGEQKPAAGAQDALPGKWKLDLAFAERNFDYTLEISRTDAGLAAVLISPRTGEHKAKSVSFKDDRFTMEVERKFEENNATFLYQGRLSGSTLSGTVAVKGMEDQFKGEWKATRLAGSGAVRDP